MEILRGIPQGSFLGAIRFSYKENDYKKMSLKNLKKMLRKSPVLNT